MRGCRDSNKEFSEGRSIIVYEEGYVQMKKLCLAIRHNDFAVVQQLITKIPELISCGAK